MLGDPKYLSSFFALKQDTEVEISAVDPPPGHLAARYHRYLREGIISPNPQEEFRDAYDCQQGLSYVSLRQRGEIVAGVRIKHLSTLRESSVATDVYGSDIADNLDMQGSALDVTRLFVASFGARTRISHQLHMMRLIFGFCNAMQVRYVLAPVKQGHFGFYMNHFGFRQIAEPVAYPGLSRKIGLLAMDFGADGAALFNRYRSFFDDGVTSDAWLAVGRGGTEPSGTRCPTATTQGEPSLSAMTEGAT